MNQKGWNRKFLNEQKNEEQWGLEETFKTLGIALLYILFQSKLTFFAKNIDEKYILMPGRGYQF